MLKIKKLISFSEMDLPDGDILSRFPFIVFNVPLRAVIMIICWESFDFYWINHPIFWILRHAMIRGFKNHIIILPPLASMTFNKGIKYSVAD